MIPASFTVLERLPLTPNGKLDRHALPQPQRPETTSDVPRTPDEVALCNLFAELLSLERVGIHDNFFALGGHSILAATLVLRIRERIGAELSLRDLFEEPTPTGVAVLLGRSSPIPERSIRGNIPIPPPSEPLPIATAQSDSLPTVRIAERHRESLVLPEPASDPFCEVIRPGAIGVPVACIGDTRPIPFLLEKLPAATPVLHLKLDGAQVWPPRFLTLAEQVEAFLPGLLRHCPERTVGLLGYSYGAILAHRLASLLLERGWHGVKLMLIEPGVPNRAIPLWSRAVTIFRRGKRRLLQTRLPADKALDRKNRPAAPEPSEIPNVNDRWSLMLAHYIGNVNRTKLPPARQHVALVGSNIYHARFAEVWRPMDPWQLTPCILQGAHDHTACFRDPYLSQWRAFLEYWYWKTASSTEFPAKPVSI
jgi:thioesterase domain-containing protein